MDAQRLILLFVFSFSLFLLYDAWQKQQQPPAGPARTVAETGGVPPVATPTPGEALIGSQPPPVWAPSRAAEPSGQIATVQTDYLLAEIDLAGGTVQRLELLRHRATDNRRENFLLFQNRPDHVYVAQSGLIGAGLPNHKTAYTIENGEPRSLADGADTIEVRLNATQPGPAKVTKVLTFHRASYVIDQRFEITNASAEPIRPFAYFQLVRDDSAAAGDSALVPTFTGAGVFSEQEKFQKVSFDEFEKKGSHQTNSDNGWIALIQHYFLSALLPANGTSREFYTKRLDRGLFAAGVILPIGVIAPDARGSISVPLYAGPQEQDRLAELAPGLDLAIDYGWLTVIASPLFWVLAQIQKWVGNWGVAIILLTFLIKLVFYPLSAASYRSMAKMRLVTPRMQKLKEQYGDDRQRLHQAMMDMYKTEKINPLGGCLPVVVQIPVFIALYWVLLASVQLRHAPFALWLQDLSAPDPYFVLPILMGLTMIIQSRLNPVPPDPIQAKVMKIMPIVFSVFFFFFPTGLVLYWLVNNILSIAQQWQITRAIERSQPAHAKR